MALSIKSDEADRLARELAAETGETLTEAVETALRERLDPAGLNFGDCFTYALADRTGYPVLCTGDDFAATDIVVVRPERAPGGAQRDLYA